MTKAEYQARISALEDALAKESQKKMFAVALAMQRKKQLDRIMKLFGRARALHQKTIAVLKRHHEWQCEIGAVKLEDGTELDLSCEYSDSTMCEETIAVLTPGNYGNDGDKGLSWRPTSGSRIEGASC